MPVASASRRMYGVNISSSRVDDYGIPAADLLETWVHGISVRSWEDIGVLLEPTELKTLQCGEESGVPGLAGWDCLFSPMPHLCTFKSFEVRRICQRPPCVSKW